MSNFRFRLPLLHLLLPFLLLLSVYAAPNLNPRAGTSAGNHFSSLEPAVIAKLVLQPAGLNLGTTPSGYGLTFTTISGGTVTTVSGFNGPKLDSVISQGQDWPHTDSNGKIMRLNSRLLIKASNGDLISFWYTGIVTVTPELLAVFAKTRPSVSFGSAALTAGFETGSATFKELNNIVFVGTGMFTANSDGTIGAEYHLSRVVP